MTTEIDISENLLRVRMEPAMGSARIYRLMMDIIEQAKAGLSNIILDFSEITEVDSVMMGTFIALELELRPLQGKLLIVNATPWIAHNFEQVGLNRIFGIHQDDPSTS